jgi:hypothetical protein
VRLNIKIWFHRETRKLELGSTPISEPVAVRSEAQHQDLVPSGRGNRPGHTTAPRGRACFEGPADGGLRRPTAAQRRSSGRRPLQRRSSGRRPSQADGGTAPVLAMQRLARAAEGRQRAVQRREVDKEKRRKAGTAETALRAGPQGAACRCCPHHPCWASRVAQRAGCLLGRLPLICSIVKNSFTASIACSKGLFGRAPNSFMKLLGAIFLPNNYFYNSFICEAIFLLLHKTMKNEGAK